MENLSQSLLLKLDLNGLKVVWLQKINIKINILILLKEMMILEKRRKKNFLDQTIQKN
jgi:hypothetical protein